MKCVICGIRKPRRSCPGVQGDICSICCGTGREETIDCPLSCEYLQDAHSHERPTPLDRSVVPNSEIDLPEEFLEKHEWLLILLGSAVLEGVKKIRSATDYDVREAFTSLIQTYRASESGLIYEALPVNPYAAAIAEAVQTRVADLNKRAVEAGSATTLRDELVMRMIVFLQRLEYANNNGRAKSRAFLDFLSRFYPAGPETLLDVGDDDDDDESELVADDTPRLIL